MITATLFLLFIANGAWLFACLSLLFTKEMLNGYITWTGWQMQTEPSEYVAYMMLVAFASQVLLFFVIYGLSARGSFLHNRYKKLKGERHDLRSALSEKTKDLEAAGKTEQLVAELKKQNETLATENDTLFSELQTLKSQKNKALFTETWKSLTSRFTKKS